MQFTEETNKRAQVHRQDFEEYAAGYEGMAKHALEHSFLVHKIAELELRIEALTPKLEDHFPNLKS